MHWTAEYLGRPWKNGADGPDAFDCYGLVRAVYRDRYGVEMPVVSADATRVLACLHAARDYADYSQWEAVTVPQDGDVLLMGCARHPHHVGVLVEGRVLHSVEGAGVLLQTVDSLAAHGWNILKTYRRRACVLSV